MNSLLKMSIDDIKQNISNAEGSSTEGNYLEAANSYIDAAVKLGQMNQIYDAAKLYQKAGINFDLSGENYSSASAYSESAHLYGVLNYVVKERELYETAGRLYGKDGSKREAAYSYRLAAKACSEEDQLANAGVFYALAAKLMQDHKPDEAKFIYENYLNSALAYAGCGMEEESKRSYKDFSTAIHKKEYNPRDNFHFDKLIKTFTDYGLDDFAGEVYVEKMNLKVNNLKVNNLKSGVSKLIYWAWGRTSDYGENWSKWMLYTISSILFFSVIYLPNPLGYGFIELSMNRGYKYPLLEMGNFFENIIRSVSFSVTVFSTLGFGDVTPANWVAELVVIIEVLMGYAFLAVFITLISRKLMRR